MTNDRETAQRLFRDAVLSAMDKSANDIFGDYIDCTNPGAFDEDLPTLFKLIDEHLETLAKRHNCPLYD